MGTVFDCFVSCRNGSAPDKKYFCLEVILLYDLIYDLIDHVYTSGDSMQQYVIYICGALILIITVVLLDTVCRVFYHFLSGGR